MSAIPTVTLLLPYTAASLTAIAVFGPQPWLTNPTITTPAGTFPDNPDDYATEATAVLVAAMLGGVASLAPAVGSQNQGTWCVVLANGAIVNAGQIAEMFTHGYGLILIVPMMQQAVAAAGYPETLNLSVAAAPPPAPAPVQMVAAQFSFGPPWGYLWAFGLSVVLGAALGQIVGPGHQQSGLAVNVVQGQTILDPVAGPLVAQVMGPDENGLYDGWWIGQAPAAPAAVPAAS